MPKPATRVGGVILFPGGCVLKLSLWQRLLFKLRIKKTIKHPYSHYEIF